MINRTQLIFGSGIVIVVVVYIVTVMGIIDNLKCEIKTLTTTVTQQDNEIRLLNNNITTLQKNISAITETVNITNDYILKIENYRKDESTKKDKVYDAVVNNEETRDWYQSALPADIVNIINDAAKSGMCKDSY